MMAFKLAFNPSPCVNFNNLNHRCPFLPCINLSSAPLRRRHHRRRLLKYRHSPSSPFSLQSEQNLLLILTTAERMSISEPVNYLKSLLDSYQLHRNNFIASADDAFNDLRSLVTVDSSTSQVMISCRRSTVNFAALLAISSLVVTVIFWSLIKSLLRKFNYDTANNGGLVYRRDRSLGGKEVLVGRAENSKETVDKSDKLRMMQLDGANVMRTKPFWSKREKRSSDEKLPNWWPALNPSGFEVDDKEEYQNMANTLIRAILDNRMRGKDISAKDIVQLRHICKTSGVKAHIEPTNARYSFFRAAVDFILNSCESTETQSSPVSIAGEDPQHFVAGLAENIDIESSRAGRMVSASVAARTRSRLLQAWALEMQGNHRDAALELLKICRIHQIFPPDKCSPEMEMVARGLERQLKVEQREFLLDTFGRVCGKEAWGSVAEALGLMQIKQMGDEENSDS